MIGITASQFKTNSMGFDIYKLCTLFMAGYERPSYNPSTNHIQQRKALTGNWYNYITGSPIPPIPPTPPTPDEKLARRLGRRAIIYKKHLQ